MLQVELAAPPAPRPEPATDDFTARLAGDPPPEYRNAPFWSWNGRLEPGELLRQIDDFARMKFGGFFMHSRVGLDTEYLSEEWFELVNFCIDAAAARGMRAWLYDEDRWPSGAAGGLVTRHPEYRMKLIRMIENPAAVPPDAIRCFAAEIDGRRARRVRRIAAPEEARPGESVVVFTLSDAPLTPWYNGYCYLDPMNPEAVDKFIEVTHEAYRRHCGGRFGGAAPGIFSDEPQFGFITTILEWSGETVYSTPWNPTIGSAVAERHGYDLLDRLMEIFYDVEGVEFSTARYHYVEVMTELFVANYAGKIGAWCRRHGLEYTGHIMGEDSLAWEAWNSGSVMRFLEHMAMPGVDQLGEVENNYRIPKLAASAARQFGRKRRLAELYGCTGWEFPAAGHKAQCEWLFANGVNFRCPHLAHYTLGGEAKRDYPASISSHLPWSGAYAGVEEALARESMILSDGEELRDILLLNPSESAWSLIRADFLESPAMRDFERANAELQQRLMAEYLDFDFGDEIILARLGSVAGPVLRVGEARYRAVVVPPMRTMRAATLALLSQFIDAGGIVHFAAAPSPRLDANLHPGPAELAERCRHCTWASLDIGRRLRLSAGGGAILGHLRRRAEGDWLMLVNTSCLPGTGGDPKSPWSAPRVAERRLTFPEVTADWRTDRPGEVYEFDPASGEFSTPAAVRTEEGWRIVTGFDRLESRFFAVLPEPPAALRPRQPNPRGRTVALTLPESMEFRLDTPNVLLLDHFVRQEGAPEYVLALDDRIRRELGREPRSGSMTQPWLRRRDSQTTAGRRVDFHADFQCDAVPAGPLFLGLETPESFLVELNGVPLPSSGGDWFIDPAIRKIPLPPSVLRPGNNRLGFTCDYHGEFQGLEAVYVAGHFGVTMEGRSGRITRLPGQIGRGSWTDRGLPFYAGNLTCRVPLERPTGAARLLLELPEWHGALLEIVIGNWRHTMLVPRRTVDITEAVPAAGPFTAELTLYGSRRNLFGPFFDAEVSPAWCGPDKFKNQFQAERQLVFMGFE